MATQVKHRRGTNAEVLAGTPAIGELWFNTTDNSIHMGDGVTQGGIKHINVNTIVDHTYRINIADEAGSTDEEKLNNVLAKNLPAGILQSISIASPIAISSGGNMKGVGSNLTTINAPDGFIDYASQRLDEIMVEGFNITGPGKTDASGAIGILKDGDSNSNRERYSKMRIRDFPVGISHSAGWGQDYNQLYVTSCDVGFITTSSAIESGWAGSGYIMSNSYFAGCNIGVQDNSMWNATYFGVVIEDCVDPLIQNTSGTASVWVNPWFEDNTNPPQWRRGSIVLGGRGVNYTDVSLFRSEDCMTVLGRDGISVFNPDVTNPEFKADGEGVKGFRAVLGSLGWTFKDNDATSAKLLQVNVGGGLTSESSSSDTTEVTLTKVTGKRHYFGSQVQNMPELGVEVRGLTSAGGNGRGYTRVAITTGTYETDGAGATEFGDRWIFNHTGEFLPATDDAFNIGSASLRVSEIFAANGTINTSDEREKTTLLELNDTEKACALELKDNIRKFQFNDAVETKGDDARIHFGVGAQTVKAIFEKHGLVAEQYSLFCKDEWEEDVTVIPCDESDTDAYEVVKSVQKTESKEVVKHKVITDSGKPVLTAVTETVNIPVTESIEVVDEQGELVYETDFTKDEDGDTTPIKQVMTHEVPVMIDDVKYFKEVKREAGYRYGIRYTELSMFILAAM